MALRRLMALALGVALLAAACGSDSDDGSSADTSEAADDTAESADIELADTGLGTVLVSGGLTLYGFTPDAQGPSVCNDDCEAAWPPLLLDEVTVGEGLDGSLFGTAARADGTLQATIDGWPLYFFSGDAAAGDTNGQAVNDVWWVVEADGTLVGAP
ncbi:MAG: hypothetical protein OEU32_09760 [Acidimicrobiia bacterium]|nr:hypothetical protein [Acidimicrobiia bacterium]